MGVRLKAQKIRAVTIQLINCPDFLCSYLRPILEGHSDIILTVNCDEVYQAAPKPDVEFLDGFLVAEVIDETLQLFAPGLAVLNDLASLVILLFYCFIPADQLIIIPSIFILVLCDPGVLGNKLLHLISQQVEVHSELVSLLF